MLSDVVQRCGGTYALSIFFLVFSALFCQFLVTLSLPFAPLLDIVTIQFKNLSSVAEIRMGIWGSCSYDANNHHNCSKPVRFGQPYTVVITQGNTSEVLIQGWTSALVYHIVPCILTLMAFILVVISLFSPKTPIALAAVVFLGVASITILQTLTIDSMVLIVATNTVKFLETGKALVTTQLGPGYWINLASFILLALSLTVLIYKRWFKD